jgi:hypothetical protein
MHFANYIIYLRAVIVKPAIRVNFFSFNVKAKQWLIQSVLPAVTGRQNGTDCAILCLRGSGRVACFMSAFCQAVEVEAFQF